MAPISSGAPAALPLLQLREKGYDGQIYGTLGAVSWFVGLIDDRTAQEVWGDDPNVLICSSTMPAGSATAADGGVRFGTEFALQPSLLTFPTPSLAGSAAVPSNVELLVNGTQRFQTDVGQGPFSINQVPLVTGAGQVTLVIRDPLGVERRVTSITGQPLRAQRRRDCVTSSATAVGST